MKRIVQSIVFIIALLVITPKLYAQVSIGLSVRIAPPALPVYTQPMCPGDGFMWTPGYWAYGDDGYYWVPGVWVRPPHYGVLWTPGYWGFDGGGIYLFHSGYWGPHVGFYGGINYGCGYGGSGFGGGMWAGNVYRYNTAVNNVNTTVIRNTYVNNTVINNNNTTVNNRTSFNGRGGVAARPSGQEQMAMREQHINPTAQQSTHQEAARQDRNQLASVNNGRPATVAMNKVNGNRFDQQGRNANNMAAGGRQMSSAGVAGTQNRQQNMNRNNQANTPVNGNRGMTQSNRQSGQHQSAPNQQQQRMANQQQHMQNQQQHMQNQQQHMPNQQQRMPNQHQPQQPQQQQHAPNRGGGEHERRG